MLRLDTCNREQGSPPTTAVGGGRRRARSDQRSTTSAQPEACEFDQHLTWESPPLPHASARRRACAGTPQFEKHPPRATAAPRRRRSAQLPVGPGKSSPATPLPMARRKHWIYHPSSRRILVERLQTRTCRHQAIAPEGSPSKVASSRWRINNARRRGTSRIRASAPTQRDPWA